MEKKIQFVSWVEENFNVNIKKYQEFEQIILQSPG